MSNFGRNSFSLAALSTFRPERSIELSPSQCGSNGCTSVITCTSRSCATAKEHSVRNVAFARALAFGVARGPREFGMRTVCDREAERRETLLAPDLSKWERCERGCNAWRPELWLPLDGDSSSKPAKHV